MQLKQPICFYSACPSGHMEKQEMEMKGKLEMETGTETRSWKQMETQLLHCCSPSKIFNCYPSVSLRSVFALLA